MVKRIIHYYWKQRVAFSKYVIVGGTSAFIDIGGFWVWYSVFGFYYLSGAAIFSALSILFNFFANRTWSFKKEDSEKVHKQLVRYVTLLGCNFTFNLLFLWIAVDIFDVHRLFAKVALSAIAVSWNFVLYRHWVFV